MHEGSDTSSTVPSHQFPPSAPPPPPPLPPKITPPSNAPLKVRPGRQLINFETPEDEVRYACKDIIRDGCGPTDVFVSFYTSIPSVIQYDKVCGLVALEMALSCPQFASHPVTGDLLSLARLRQFTTQGEMFSAENMASLASEVGADMAEVSTRGFSESIDKTVEHVMAGHPILVPYDIAADMKPSMLHGRKAHWAVIAGIVLRVPKDVIESKPVRQDTVHSNLYHGCSAFEIQPVETARVHLLGKQGKSRYLAAWPYDVMAKSNTNLREYPEFIEDNKNEYTLPDAGIEEGLAAKIVLLR